MPLAHTSLMRRLVIRRLLLYASLCALLVGHQYTVHGATASVAGMYGAGSSDESETSLYVLGLSAPAANNVSPYTYTTQSLSANAATVSSVFSQFNGESACMAILGPAGGQLLKYIYASTNNLVFTTPLFSPLLQTMNKQTNGGLYPSYNEKVYWLLPSDQAQASGLMFFLAQRPLVPLNQILLAYTDDGISVSSVTLLTGIAPVLGITGLSMQTTGGQSFSTATYSSVFPTAPHIVYQLLESAFTYSIDWIGQMVSDSNFIKANTTIGTTITFDYITLQAYTSKASSTAVLPPSNILTASPVPGIGSTEYQAATDFATEASSTISSISTDAEKNFVMAGWAGGTALMQALNMYSGPTFGAKSTFYNVLSNQQLMFLTSDLFYGTMGPSSVSNTAQSQGAINECRWAGNNVWFHTLKKSGSTYDSTPVHGALFQYAFGTCGNLNSAPTPSQFALPRTIHVVGFSPSDNDMISSMCSQTVSAIETVANTNLFWHHSSHAYRGYCLPTSISSASSDWSTHQSTYVTTSLMGVIPDAIVTSSPPSSLILDFMPQTTQLHVAKQNFVYLFPTLEQELYVLASYLGGVVTSTSVVCAVVSSSTYSDDITTLLKKTLTTFGITPSSGNVNQPTGALSSSISASCTHTFVIGAASTDAAGILGVMQQQSTSIVLMSFEDLTKQYAAFASAFASAGTAVTNRLVFATNLPMWTGNTMSSGTLSSASALSTVGEFVETLSPAAQTPAAARAFIVAMLYDQLTIGTSWGQPNMQNALYGNRTVHVGGMTFGPFKVTWGTESLINYGACDISVMSYSRVVDPSTPPLSQPTNPSLVYSASTSTAVVAAAVDASEQSCVELQQSSSLSGYVPPPTTPQPGESTTTRTTTTSTPATNSAGHSSSAVDQKLKDFLSALVVLLVVLVLYILLLLLLRFGVLQAVWDCLVSLPCCRCCRDESDENAVRDAGKVRAAIDEELREDRRLEYEALDISPPSESVSLELTVVFLEVEQWRSLWARQPEVMSRVERHYQRCVRRAALKHQVYGMPPCEGLWVFVCPSSDVGVKFAQSVVKDVSKCNRSDGSVVSGEYSRLGCGNSAVKGLRLLVAVHRGAATRYAGASGRPCYRGAAVSGAVGAAYAAGAAGLVVLTASALTDSGLSAESKEVQSVAAQPDKQQYVEEALYALSVVHSSGPRPLRRSSENEEVDEVKSTVFFVDAASRSGDGGLQPWCVKRFEAHYETIPEQERIADLRCLAELFTLSGALSETRGGPADYNVLLQSVSGQVASMMECRHGFTRAATHPPPPEGHSKGTPIPMVSSRAAREEGVGFLERTRPQTSVAAGDRRTYRRRSEHRHHSYVDDDMDSAED